MKPIAKTDAPPKQNLSDDFAKSGLKALGAIKYDKSISFSDDARDQSADEHITDADAEARTDSEKEIVKILKTFHTTMLLNNLKRHLIYSKSPAYNAETIANRATLSLTDPEMLTMSAQEDACASSLDDVLRQRYFAEKLTACDEAFQKSEKFAHVQ